MSKRITVEQLKAMRANSSRGRSQDLSHIKSRYRYFFWIMLRKYQPNCYKCGLPFTWDDLPSRGIDLLTEHHLDGNHLNSAPENSVFEHRACHKSYHTKDNINK